jgi:hypothetical protein
MRGVIGVTVATVLTLGACATTETQATPSPSQTSPSQTSPSPAATPSTQSPPPVTATILVEYQRKGGLIGSDDHLVVRQDGSYSLTRRTGSAASGRLSEADVAALRRLLEASNFGQIPQNNPGDNIADGYTYRIVYQGREVLAEDGGVPPALEQVFGRLDVILNRR